MKIIIVNFAVVKMPNFRKKSFSVIVQTKREPHAVLVNYGCDYDEKFVTDLQFETSCDWTVIISPQNLK